MSSQQTPYLPAGLALPYYARLDLAFLEPLYFGAAAPGLIYTTTSGDGALTLVSFASWTIVTSATVAARTVFCSLIDQTGATLWQVPAAAFVPESSSVRVTMLSGQGSTEAIGSSYVISVPPTILHPGDQLRFDASNWDAGDQITSLNFERMVIPTGPALDQPQPAATPLPL